ncbi:flagellar hook capping FlgD N-terminal domain-containing protein [Microbacterium sp. 77mftsu3.1]|uniref:flagellar hook capping FlgD N-terminal domain-containing protein n=1 Tax=Microbacterium sp. 77mftsu3.1 TaxID=1761802 RepID=UPI0003812D87|nr:flagellar hook capping FlgD N-terminal domain-containing protein [Microbacterium sp. 77mftsu3.1]SDH36402.1 flagellar basal-body rod modification protein FlgD [Microbacterium sp. 77mftsu3.1]
MTAITGVAPAAASLPTSPLAPTKAPKQTLDSETFLHLLTTQLRNQDPSSPMNTNEMMAQTTQLASMEQLTSMSKTLTENFALGMRDIATSLIGKSASYIDADGKTQTGKVTKVSFEEGVPALTIGDKTVSLDAVSGVNASDS